MTVRYVVVHFYRARVHAKMLSTIRVNQGDIVYSVRAQNDVGYSWGIEKEPTKKKKKKEREMERD